MDGCTSTDQQSELPRHATSTSGGRFRKKPVVIEAVRVVYAEMLRDGPECSPFDSHPSWLDEAVIAGVLTLSTKNARDYAVVNVNTLEGVMEAIPGDWIIRGVKGELYPCKPDIFALTYEAEDPAVAPSAQGWRDIASAPKDAVVLVYDDGYIGKGMTNAMDQWLDVEVGRDDAIFNPPPTHWMPLPDPPASDPGEAVDEAGERKKDYARGGNLWCSALGDLPHRRVVVLRAIVPEKK